MPSPEKWENMAEVLRAMEPSLEEKLVYCRTHLPDPVTQPITTALLAAYESRIALKLDAIRGGAEGLKDEFTNRPMISEEVQELESWIQRQKPGAPRRKLTAKDEDIFGDWFVSKMGYSYSRTKWILGRLRHLTSGKGAPSKRPETLHMMDARIANGWSYSEVATRMCDCGAAEHTEHCSERIRKRLKALESLLAKYGIRISPTPEKNPG